MRIHCGIRVNLGVPLAGREALQRVDVVAVVHAQQLLAGRFRRFMPYDQLLEARGDELVLDRRQPLGPLGMAFAHLVQAAIGMGDESQAHGAKD